MPHLQHNIITPIRVLGTSAVKVYYDDMPPYYAVRLDDGSERSTVRARLETRAERAAAEAAEQHAAAEARAAAAAAELLAEEERAAKRAKEKPRRPTSGGKR